MDEFGIKPFFAIDGAVVAAYLASDLPPLFLQEKNSAQAVMLLFETISTYLNLLRPEAFPVLGRLSALRQSALGFDTAAPAAIQQELKALVQSGFHCNVDEVSLAQFRRVTEIGISAIERSPVSLALSSTDDACLEGLQI